MNRAKSREAIGSQKISAGRLFSKSLHWLPAAACITCFIVSENPDWLLPAFVAVVGAVIVEVAFPDRHCKCRTCRRRKISDKRWESFVGEWTDEEQRQLRIRAHWRVP